MSVAATMPQTILEVFDATVKAHADRPAMLRKRGDAWEPITWTGYQALVARAARALVAHGVGPGSGVVVLSANRPEWFVTNLAGMTVGARVAGIYTNNTPEYFYLIKKVLRSFDHTHPNADGHRIMAAVACPSLPASWGCTCEPIDAAH